MPWLLLPALVFGFTLAGDIDPPEPTQVQLDVAVTDGRGRPVAALTADDFHVTDGGAPVRVASARFVGPPPSSLEPLLPPIASSDDEREAARRPGTRIFTFFLDEYHVDAADAPRVRELVSGFIRSQTADGDLMLVLKPLDSLLSLRLTRDRAAVLDTVASFEGRRGDYTARNPFERDLIAGDPARINAVRSQIAVSALHALARHLARFRDGRKALVVVSEGFAPRPVRRGGTVLPTVDAVVRAANEATVAIYAVDPRLWHALPDASADTGGDVLRRLAGETDGRSIAAPVEDGLRRIAAEMSGYYLLALEGAADGRYHPLEVRVARSGAAARTRPGYWAITSDDLARAKRAAAPLPPPPVLPPVRTSRLIVPWFGQARGSDGRTRVTLVWEPAPALTGERGRGLPPSRLRVKAVTLDGAPVFEGVVTSSSAAMSGVASRAVFEVPPGRIRLQMAIEDAAARVLDTDVRDVVVGALPGPLTFGTAAVFRARTARELNTFVADPEATPVAARAFSRVERLLIRLPLYTRDSLPAAVTAALTNRIGASMRALPIVRQPDGDLYAVDLPLSGLAAGEYGVLMRASAGGTEVSETVTFRVTP